MATRAASTGQAQATGGPRVRRLPPAHGTSCTATR